jgi:hypothetical protein
MAKISVRGAYKLATAKCDRSDTSISVVTNDGVDKVIDTIVLCSDGRVLIKTDVHHTSYGGSWSRGGYSILATFKNKELIKDQPRMIAAFNRFAEKRNFIPEG